jgi:hypothetical protein
MVPDTIVAYLFYGLMQTRVVQARDQAPARPCRAMVPAVWIEDS